MRVFNDKEDWKIILSLVLLMIVLSLITNNDYLIYVGMAVGFLSLLSEYFRRGLIIVWDKLTSVLGDLVSGLVLSLVFYLILTPLAVLRRIVKREREPFYYRGNKKSFYIERDYVFKPEDFEKAW